MFDWLTQAVSGGATGYLVVLAAAAGDVVLPLIPSETIIITAGILAGRGDLSVVLIMVAAAVGAAIGDNAAYWLGRGVGDPIARRLFRGEKGQRRLRWAERAITAHGPLLIVAGRFIPGGRTASTFAAGTVSFPWRRFVLADLVAASVWGVYSGLLGYLGGSAFKHSAWKPLLVSLGIAVVVALLVEVWRQVQKRRGRDVLGDALT